MKTFDTISWKNRVIRLKTLVAMIYLLLGFITISRADIIISGGTSLKGLTGSSIVAMDNMIVRNGGIIDNAGTLILKKNLTNENVASASIGSGTVEFSGTSAQAINGKSIIQNLTINNPAGIANGGENQVNGILTLTNGLFILGSNNLLLGSTAMIAGSPSATAMLVPIGTGELRKTFSGIGSFVYPVGDNTVTPEYSPVTLSFTAGSFGAGNYAGVSLVNAMYPGSPGGSYIQRYWGITQSGITGFSCNPTFQYVPADVVGTESSIYCVRISPSSVDYFNVANTTSHQLSAVGLTSFGSFTGYQTLTNKTLNISSVLLEGLYNGGGIMRKAQNEVGDQFPGTTADQIRIELHNSGSYTSIAYTLKNINLSTSGYCSGTIPGIISGSYYVTIRHRNSIETTTASPVSFVGGSISYSFNLPTQAYGSNMKQMTDGHWVIYCGDVDQDGGVGTLDMGMVDNKSAIFASGYLPEDVNGDGGVGTLDMGLIDNNSADFVSAITP